MSSWAYIFSATEGTLTHGPVTQSKSTAGEWLGTRWERKVVFVVPDETQRNKRASLRITYCLVDVRLHLLTQHAFKDKGVAKLLCLYGG